LEYCVPVFAILILAAFPVGIILGFAAIKAGQRKRFQSEIARNKAHELSRGAWFAIRYASERKYKRWLKFFPWETSGIIHADDSRLTLYLDKLNGQRNVELSFDPRSIRIGWAGSEVLRNGVTSWLIIETGYERHYITSETGTFVFNSSSTTHKMYEELTKLLNYN
jgi:hypothetical protein